MGAEALAHLGREVERVQGPLGKVARLSGLDPAAPWFDIQDPSLRLTKDDGDLVDVVHTNSGELVDVRY